MNETTTTTECVIFKSISMHWNLKSELKAFTYNNNNNKNRWGKKHTLNDLDSIECKTHTVQIRIYIIFGHAVVCSVEFRSSNLQHLQCIVRACVCILMPFTWFKVRWHFQFNPGTTAKKYCHFSIQYCHCSNKR